MNAEFLGDVKIKSIVEHSGDDEKPQFGLRAGAFALGVYKNHFINTIRFVSTFPAPLSV
jgi:hypothetical protein